MLPRLPSLPFSDLQALLDTLDVAVAVKSDHLTPNKNKSLPSSMMDIQSLSFVAFSLVQALLVSSVSSEIVTALLHIEHDVSY